MAAPNRKPRNTDWQEPEEDFYAANDNDRTTSGTFAGAQAERTISGQFNQYRTQTTPRNSGVNDTSLEQRISTDSGVSAYSSVSRPTMRFRNGQTRRGIRRFVRKKPVANKAYNYSRVTLVNVSILGWGMTLWFVQFWLALLSTALFGVLAAYDAFTETNVGWFFNGILLAGITTIATAVDFVFGTSVSDYLNIQDLASGVLVLPWFVGVTTLLIMGIQYELARMNSLTGEGAHLKMGAFIFALFGYFVPILNLFPWFIFWLLAVWRYPK